MVDVVVDLPILEFKDPNKLLKPLKIIKIK